MRNGQNKRMRNRNRKTQNPITRVYESNGPEVKIRGTASHVAEKYLQLARDAQGSGDPVGAENFYQHAEHYFRIIAAAQEQFRQTQPFRNDGGGQDDAGDNGDDGDDGDEGFQPYGEPFSPQPQYQPREAQPQQHRPQQQHRPHQNHRPQPQYQPQPQPQPQPQVGNDGDIERLPSFITGGQPVQGEPNGNQNGGYERPPQQDRGDRNDRFSHRRRRRHNNGPRNDVRGGGQGQGGEDFSPGNE